MKLATFMLLLAAAMPTTAPAQVSPGAARPPIDQLKEGLGESRIGFDLALRNAGFHAGWVPRGFITVLLQNRPSLLPGEPLAPSDYQHSVDYREGLPYRPGLTDWGAHYRAERYDREKALEQLNNEHLRAPMIGLGRSLGYAADPVVILGSLWLLSFLARLPERWRMRREQRAYAAAQRFGPPPFPQQPPPHAAPGQDHREDWMADSDSESESESEPRPGPGPGQGWEDPTQRPRSRFSQGRDAAPEVDATAATDAPIPTDPAAPAAPLFAVPPTVTEESPAPAAAPAVAANSDQETAFTAYQACRAEAEAGSAEHQFQLGGMFRYGRGVNPSREEATYWFRRAAEAGHPQAQFELARRLFQGIGVLPDENAAAVWLEQAAQQGLIDARFNLATLYARGRGVERDPEAAMRWLEECAADGDVDAGELLQTVYEQGWLGQDADPGRAQYWQQRVQAGRG